MVRKSRQKTRRGRIGAPNGSNPRTIIPKPPMFIPSPRMTHTFRFTVSTSGGYTINVSNLLNLYCVATAATTTARLCQGMRLKRVEIWGQPPALGAAAVTCSCEWTGGSTYGFGPSWSIADTSSGIEPCHIKTRPPKDSIASFWINNLTHDTTLFSITVPVGATIDLTIQMVLIDTESPTTGQSTTGATVGRVYGCYLTSANLPPVGLTTLP